MKTMSIKQAKNFRKAMVVSAVALTMGSSATGAFAMTTVSASDDKATGKSGESGTQGISVDPDSSTLDKAVKTAEDAGISVGSGEETTKVVKASELETAKAEVKADYQSQADELNEATKAYTESKDKYEAEKAEYEKELAEFNKEEAENKDKPGQPTSTVLQQLILQAEGEAKMTSNNISLADGYFYKGDGTKASTTPILSYRGNSASEATNLNADGVATKWYHLQLNKGKSITTTHTNLTNSSYRGKKITKMVQTVKNNGNSTENGSVGLYVASDPTMGVWYDGYVDPSNGASRNITVSRTYYYEDGSKVTFGDGDAYISVGSLNAGYVNDTGGSNSKHVEKSKITNATFVPVNDGSIKHRSDGYDYADINGWFNGDGSVFQTLFNNGNDSQPENYWDAATSPNRWYGTAVYKLDKGSTSINLTAQTDSQSKDGNATTWWTSSTSMPFKTKPTFNPIKPDYPTKSIAKTKLIVIPDAGKDVEAGTTVGNTDASDNGKVFMKGDDVTFPLSISAMPANRTDDVTSINYHDALPKEFDYKDAKVFDKDGKDITSQFTVAYDKDSHELNVTANDEFLKQVNADKTTAFDLPTVNVYGSANKDDVTLKNTYNFSVNDVKVDSNTVEFVTPKIDPIKDVEAGTVAGDTEASIDTQYIQKGDKITYPLKSNDLLANRATDVAKLSWTDVLSDNVDYNDTKIYDADKNDISDDFNIDVSKDKKTIKVTAKDSYLKKINADKTKAWAMPTIDIYATANKDNADILNSYVLGLNNTETTSNEVVNHTPGVDPVKDVEAGTVVGDTDASINNDVIMNGQDVTYPLTVSDLPANRAYDVKTLNWTDTLDSSIDYKSLKVYSKTGEDITDKFRVSVAGQKLTITATDEYLAEINADKTQAWAMPIVDVYGVANKDGVEIPNDFTVKINDNEYKSNVVENSTPTFNPTKEDLDGKGNNIDGENVLQGDTLHYALNWDLTGLNNLAITDDLLVKGLSFTDDYDEKKLDVTDATKSDFKITLADSGKTETNDTTVTSKVGDNATFVDGSQTADKFDMDDVTYSMDNGKLVIKAKNPAEFLQKYAGKKLVITFNPVVKKGASGVIYNTATQNNFGDDVDTNTVKNPIKDVTNVEKEVNIHTKVTKTTDTTTTNTEKTPEKDAEGDLPTTGSDSPVQRVVSFMLNLFK